MKENAVFKDTLTDEFDAGVAQDIIDNMVESGMSGFDVLHHLSRGVHTQEKTDLISLIDSGKYGNKYERLFHKSTMNGREYFCCKINNDGQYSIMMILPRYEMLIIFKKNYGDYPTEVVHYCIASQKRLQDFITNIIVDKIV